MHAVFVPLTIVGVAIRLSLVTRTLALVSHEFALVDGAVGESELALAMSFVILIMAFINISCLLADSITVSVVAGPLAFIHHASFDF